MAPRSRSTDDDQAGQAARAEDSASVQAVEPTDTGEPAATELAEPAVEPTDTGEAVEPDAPEAARDLPDPVGRPPLIEVSEAAARGAFPKQED